MRGLRFRAVTLAPLLGVLVLTGCRGEADPTGEVEELRVEGASPDTLLLPRVQLERARSVATELGQDLAGLVFAAMEEQGVPAAVQVCSEVAQERTAGHGRDGVYVRRISDRLRNVRNAPDEAERRELERMHALEAEGVLPPEIIRLVDADGARHLHLLRPIRVQQGCLACHGQPEDISPEVRRILAERYPADRAVGYSEGELRGAFSVRVPVEATN
jgi:hypothetical protein